MKSHRVDVLAANVIMNADSWDVMPYSSEERAPTIFNIKAEGFFFYVTSHGIAFVKGRR